MKLTDQQIANWRKVLFAQCGAYAFVMSSADVQAYADQVQKQVNQLSRTEKKSQ